MTIDHGMLLVAIGILVVTIGFHLMVSARSWGALTKAVSEQGKDIDKLNTMLFPEDGVPHFVSRAEHDERGKSCPAMICASIKRVEDMVKIYAGKLETNLQAAAALNETVKQIQKVQERQERITGTVFRTINELSIQVEVLKNQKRWDGAERRDSKRASA